MDGTCDFCKKPEGDRIPICGKKAVTKIRIQKDKKLPELLEACGDHRDLEGAEQEPAVYPDLPSGNAEIEACFRTVPTTRYYCEGCGDLIVTCADDGMFGRELNGLDILVMGEHIASCIWRRAALRRSHESLER